MRVLVAAICVVFAWLPIISAADRPTKATMKPEHAEFIALTEGIVGGFAPPIVRQQIIIVKDKSANSAGRYAVLVMKREKDRISYRKGGLTEGQFSALVDGLNKKDLWALPTEKPRDIEDIYGMDTSLQVHAGQKRWHNGGPAGCVHGTSKDQPSAAQKQRFGDIVASVRKLSESATEKVGNTEFDEARRAIGGNGRQ